MTNMNSLLDENLNPGGTYQVLTRIDKEIPVRASFYQLNHSRDQVISPGPSNI
jgi:hypothetical protein